MYARYAVTPFTLGCAISLLASCQNDPRTEPAVEQSRQTEEASLRSTSTSTSTETVPVLDDGRAHRGIEWLTSLDAALTQARNENKPVLLYFYSDMSLLMFSDQPMEARVVLGSPQALLQNPGVIKALENFVCVRVNHTMLTRKEVDEVLRRYKVYMTPVVTFIDSKGRLRNDLVFIGRWREEEMFLDYVRRVETTEPGKLLPHWAIP